MSAAEGMFAQCITPGDVYIGVDKVCGPVIPRWGLLWTGAGYLPTAFRLRCGTSRFAEAGPAPEGALTRPPPEPLCGARQPGFSIHDDLLAHPQFEIVFAEEFVSEQAAYDAIKRSRAQTEHATDVSQTDLTSKVRESAAADATAGKPSVAGEDADVVSETFEILTSPHARYLCLVPTIARTPELNQTATELAKAEEARELSRASTRGWELMSGLNGQCLYFMSGWWSYSFCYGKDIVQFHALPNGANGGPPVRDPASHEYVLGTVRPKKTKGVQKQTDVAQDAEGAGADSKAVAPPNTELQVKGDQRYLVQRMDGGTICDLTGRPRTIEVQYHCSPGASRDRIGWVKEVTTCTYLMVVHTPRLCNDVAFLPPKETRAHPITCRAIVSDDDELDKLIWIRTLEAKEKLGVNSAPQAKIGKDPKQHPSAGMTIGGVVIGGKRVLGGQEGSPAVELPPPRGIVSNKKWQLLEKLSTSLQEKVTSESGKIKINDELEQELEQMGIDKETVEALRQELATMDPNEEWQLAFEVIPPQDGANAENGGAGGDIRFETRRGKKVDDQTKPAKKNAKGKSDDDEEEGSQEVFYKEEL
ncbi:hypothetical protein OQA88_3255 [Cercophora sp. LCS_1]